jgi:alkaline phosphatase D
MPMATNAKRGLTRRQLLVRSASAAALAAIGGLARPYLSRAADRPRIAYGVQSGDVSTSSAMVWARADRAARMLVDCSTVESFATIIRSSSIDALPDHDFTAKLLLEGLPSGQDFFYRVRFDDSGDGTAGETLTGHFRTAPVEQCLIESK